MTYTVNRTDSENNPPITVYDNTSSTDTSLTFPGRNVTGYGQIIAENFLHLLENFASANDPTNPIEGQLWYDTATGFLKVYTVGSETGKWRSASGIQRGGTEPDVGEANAGELWVDTTSQQLYIFSGTRWILVGPDFSTGLRSGPIIETVVDADNVERVIIVFYVDDVPVTVISKDSFIPKIAINGFTAIRPGINITTADTSISNFDAKLYGIATSADSLRINNVDVEGSKFLRSNTVNTTEFEFNVRNNSGITLGVDGTFKLSTSTQGGKIYNSVPGSAVDVQLNRGGIPKTTLRVVDQKIGVNVLAPEAAVDVDGSVKITERFITTSTSSNSLQTAGGITVAGSADISGTLLVNDVANTKNILPKANDTYDLGIVGTRWKNVRAKTIVADEIVGTSGTSLSITAALNGTANFAQALSQTVKLQVAGDVQSNIISFNAGSTPNSPPLQFQTSITSALISSKPAKTTSLAADQLLVYRETVGLVKINRNDFIGDLGIPVGAILPYAGPADQVPYGYLLCDGGEVERTRFSALFDCIGNTYGTPSIGVNTFKLPDLRGRFPLGRDNMDNSGIPAANGGKTVPTTLGNFVDAGGGAANRVPGSGASALGGNGGDDTNSLTVANLPDHKHNMKGTTGTQYYATRVDTAVPLDTGSFSGKGPTLAGQNQYLPDSGGVKTTGSLGDSFSVMNPFLTINYIIRSGPPNF